MKKYRFPGILTIVTLFLIVNSGPVFAGMLVVQKDGTPIRADYHKDARILFEADKNFPVATLEKKGEWLKIRDFEGEIGYVREADLTSQIKGVVVIRGANVRSGPGASYEVSFTAPYGVAFEVVEKAGAWLKVRHERGATGWIYDKLVWGNK